MNDLHALVARAHHSDGPIANINVWRFPYASTHRLDAIDVTFTDGTTRALLAKHTGVASLLDVARGARSARMHDPDRERIVYEHLLAGSSDAPQLVVASEDVIVLTR